MRKESSTNYQNEQQLVVECPMTFTFTMLGTRWKPIILWKINEGVETMSDLQKHIPLISKKMLYEDVNTLLERGLVTKAGADQPKYSLTTLGKSMLPVLEAAWDWGNSNSSNIQEN